MASNTTPGSEIPIAVKITYQGVTKRFKIPLGDLTPAVLPDKLRGLLGVPSDRPVTFERFSDSANSYISLDPSNAPAYRTLFRAAKAKQKLRLRATSPADCGECAIPKRPTHGRGELLAHLRAHQPKLALNPVFAASEATLNNAAGGVSVSTQADILAGEDEAPVPKTFAVPEGILSGIAAITREQPTKSSLLAVPGCHWSVYCNSCDLALPDDHWHCDTCDDGDYDLCSACHDSGKHCRSAHHFMVKRWIENGKVVTSRTERVAPKSRATMTLEDFAFHVKAKAAAKPEPVTATMPGAFAEEKKPEPSPAPAAEPEVLAAPTRTCNSCVKVFPEQQFVTCLSCDDFDLCLNCHCSNKHGHHPGHAFQPAVEGSTVRPLADFLLAAGRNVRHAALCDGCDRHVYGVRHKCLNCPDWDFCSDCIKSAPNTHPGHRFVPVYEPLGDAVTCRTRHVGIYCDGPLCKDQPAGREYITGVRYKCAICDDTDFCANCEAAPTNRHNRTHPLIKFKTPVRNVSVTTKGEDAAGHAMPTLGDIRSQPAAPASTVSKVQPIVEVKPAEAAKPKPVEKIEIKDLLAEPITERIKVRDLLSPVSQAQQPGKTAVNASTAELNAHFVRDTVVDGTNMSPGQQFVQVWTLRNPGPHAWPAGCSVCYVGGDNMLSVQDPTAPGVADAVASNATNSAVGVGEQVSFRVTMKAPTRGGTSISYWRLKTEDGMPFGHRLWCHISVPNAQGSNEATVTLSDIIPMESDPDMVRFVEEISKKRDAMKQAVRDTELRVKKLEEAQKRQDAQNALYTRGWADGEQDRQNRIQMLRALHAARLAAVSAERKDTAAAMKLAPRPKIEEMPVVPVSVQSSTELAPKAARAPPAPTVEDAPEKDEKSVAAIPSEVQGSQPATAGSTMIFPTLEKESPASSTHDVVASSVHTAATVAETVKTETVSEAPLSPARTETTGFFEEDAQTIRSFDEDESDDDGFLTDEEYDVLDASDEEGHA